MECFSPGRVLVLPDVVHIEEYEKELSERLGMPFDFEYSVGDVISKIDGLTDRGARFGLLPMVGRVPEGRESEASLGLGKLKYVKASCPDFAVRAAANVSLDAGVIDNAVSFVQAVPVSSGCGGGCTVAVLDSGVDGSILATPSALHSVQYDVQDPTGLGKPTGDDSGHGSVVAAIINKIAPEAKLISIKTMSNNVGSVSDVLSGLYLSAALNKVDIINLSLSVSCDPDRCQVCGALQSASTNASQLGFFFQHFLSSCDVCVLAAAGNGYANLAMPAEFPGVISVGDFDFKNGAPSSNSAYSQVPTDRYILAPGARGTLGEAFGIAQSFRRPTYFHGTSFATAFATGVAARLVCGIKGGACGGLRKSVTSLFGHVTQEFSKRSNKSWPGYDVQKHGLGLLQY